MSLKDVLCDIEADPDWGHRDLSLNNNAAPPILAETWLGSSGGRPPHLDSNFQYAGAVNLVVAPFVPPVSAGARGIRTLGPRARDVVFIRPLRPDSVRRKTHGPGPLALRRTICFTAAAEGFHRQMSPQITEAMAQRDHRGAWRV